MSVPLKINLAEAFASFDEAWQPRIAGTINEFHAKVVKMRGEFVWHHHEDEDELFLVVAGTLVMQFRDGDVTLGPGELFVVPAGVEHCPRAPDEAHVLLLERATTVNTGSVGGERTATPVPL
jgi:mannose-6-phosphate isomerase-like protein (cupin superfamily)